MDQIKLLLIALSIFAFCSSSALAQNQQESVTATVNISANVIQTIELITVNSMTLGDLQPGQEEVYVNPVNSVNAGFMIAVGIPDVEFRLTYLRERVLTHSSGEGNLTFTYELSGNFEEEQSTSVLLRDDDRNIRFNTEGRYYIWVGGRIDLRNAKPGNYQGDFTIEIDYI